MEWVIGSIVGAFTIAIQLYLWVLPRLQSKTADKKAAKIKMKEGLEVLIKKAEAYEDFGLGESREIFNNPNITQKFRNKVKILETLASECIDWRSESWLVIRVEVMRFSIDNNFKWLNDSLMTLIGGNLDGVLYGYYGHFSEPIYQAIYEGNLTFELARDSLAQRRWDQSRQIGDRVITIKEVVESPQFHKVVEELQKLQTRQSVKMLREKRNTLIVKAQSLLQEASHAYS